MTGSIGFVKMRVIWNTGIYIYKYKKKTSDFFSTVFLQWMYDLFQNDASFSKISLCISDLFLNEESLSQLYRQGWITLYSLDYLLNSNYVPLEILIFF